MTVGESLHTQTRCAVHAWLLILFLISDGTGDLRLRLYVRSMAPTCAIAALGATVLSSSTPLTSDVDCFPQLSR